MSETFVNRLIEFAESGNQQKICLNNQVYQGWIMEISDDALLISTGYSDKVGKDIWVSFKDLDHAELFFWNNQHDQWERFSL